MRSFLITVVCMTFVIACYAPVKTNVPVGPCPSCKSEPVPVVKAVPPPPPPVIPAPVIVKKKIEVLPFYFAFDKATLENQQDAISRAIEYLKDDPAKTVELQGNCDNRGSEAYNMKLGQRRANTVKSILENKGIDSKRLTTKSFGESKATGNHAKDRRVDIVVIK